jgi:hypothetical protein
MNLMGYEAVTLLGGTFQSFLLSLCKSGHEAFAKQSFDIPTLSHHRQAFWHSVLFSFALLGGAFRLVRMV